MAFDPTSGDREYRFYFKIELTGRTLYLSNEYFTLSDGTAINGIVVSLSPLLRRAGSILDPRLELPRLTLDLDNGYQADGSRFQDYLDLYTWANRPATLYIGQGTTAANFVAVFAGITQFPGGVEYDDETCTVRLADARGSDGRTLPAGSYTKTLYANMEDLYVNTPIPLVYGDWRTTAANGETVPCVQIDSTAGTGGTFKIAAHALKEIEVVYLNGADITANCTLDAANGQFTITTGTYTSGTDTVTANVQGATDDGTTGGTLLQTAPAVLNDLLQTHLSVSAANIDSTALTAWAGELTAPDYVRRVINSETISDTLIAELLSDGFADLALIDGKYTPKYRVVAVGAALATYRAEDILTNTNAVKIFEVSLDPEYIYANAVLATYNRKPTTGGYVGRYTAEDAGAVADVGSRVRRSLTFNWLYVQAGAEGRADKELYTFGIVPEVVEVELGPTASQLTPTDQFRLVYSKYAETAVGGQPFQARDISLDPNTLAVRVTAWSMIRLVPHLWTAAGADNWEAADATEKANQGFWTSDDGEAGPQYYWADSTAPAYAAASSYEQTNQGFWTDAAGEAAPGDPGSAGSVWKDETSVDPDSWWI